MGIVPTQKPSTFDTVVVIGASLGGIEALKSLFGQLPADFPAAVLCVLHIDSHRSELPALLARHTTLPVAFAVDGEHLMHGRIYVAPPDHHMLIDARVVRLSKASKENFCRPAIDPLFRSAALSDGIRVIGVILTGMLNDGTVGLHAIKANGGVAIVQDPADAVEASMPTSALRYVDVDHTLPVDQMGPLLERLVAGSWHTRVDEQQRRFAQAEYDVMRGEGELLEKLATIGAPSTFACPECHGCLWRLENGAPLRFRCHTGHSYTLESLEHEQARATEEALFMALRAIQERLVLLTEMTSASRIRLQPQRVAQLEEDMLTVQDQAQSLRAVIDQSPGSAARIDA